MVDDVMGPPNGGMFGVWSLQSGVTLTTVDTVPYFRFVVLPKTFFAPRSAAVGRSDQADSEPPQAAAREVGAGSVRSRAGSGGPADATPTINFVPPNAHVPRARALRTPRTIAVLYSYVGILRERETGERAEQARERARREERLRQSCRVGEITARSVPSSRRLARRRPRPSRPRACGPCPRASRPPPLAARPPSSPSSSWRSWGASSEQVRRPGPRRPPRRRSPWPCPVRRNPRRGPSQLGARGPPSMSRRDTLRDLRGSHFQSVAR